MKPPPPNIQYIELDVSSLDEKGLEDLCTGLVQAGPNSALVQANPPLQTSLAQVGTALTAAKALSQEVIADTTKLTTDKKLHMDAVSALVTGVIQYKGLIATTAKNVAEVKGSGFKPLEKTPEPVVVEVPAGIKSTGSSKTHKVKVSAIETGPKRRYAAQFCLDPVASNTWTNFQGDGKSHWLAGYKAGTQIWVRYATVRGHEQSDWCTPVLVTIP